MSLTLNQLAAGAKGTIEKFSDEQAAFKLMTMGILPGQEVKVIRKAPLGGAIYLKTERQQFAIRNTEAACIVIK